jgi:transposase-like protein
MPEQGMPWKVSSVMEEKLRFVFDYERDEQTMTDLCAGYGIARETGYVWPRRYRERGVAGLRRMGSADVSLDAGAEGNVSVVVAHEVAARGAITEVLRLAGDFSVHLYSHRGNRDQASDAM